MIKPAPSAMFKKAPLALAIPFIMAAQAQALQFYNQGIEGSFDSQLSIGSSWRMQEQNQTLLTPGNNEDGNANFKKNDAFSQIFKGSHDLQVSYQNVGGFVRGKYWYDYALKNNSVDHGHTPNGLSEDEKLDDSDFNDLAKFSGAQLLDAFVYGQFDVNDMALDLRLGKQVVSWGESTFILGGVNAINPVDVSAFRRPGAEIKEGLIPVNMAFASIGLTDNLSAEGFYQLEFQETVIPGCGTYFSINDYAPQGCEVALTAAGPLSRSADDKARDDGQFGLAFRYLAEHLGDTEFGLYFMNIHSRTPLISGIKHNLSVQDQGQIQSDAIAQYTAAGGIPGFDSVQAFVGAKIGQARAADTQYFASYPEDIQLLGLSFATNAGPVALSGEISHKKDMPLQINATQLISAALTGASTSQELADAVNATAGGGVVQGYRLFDVSQVQATTIAFLDPIAGASRVTFIGEVGFSHVHDLDESQDAIKFSRSGIYDPASDAEFDNDGFVTQNSWGYRARLMAEYSDVFSGINLKPVLAWSDDVKGFAPQPGGAFREGQQSLGLTLKADYLSMYNAEISYTQYMGGDYSMVKDRDFASVSVGVQF